MRKAVFLNHSFYYVIIGYFILLIGWNSYAVFTGNYIGLIPIVIHLLLLILIITKNSISRIALKIFAVVVLIGASSLKLISALLKTFIGEFSTVNNDDLIFNLLKLTIGVIILNYVNKTIRIESVSNR
ncbi:MAG: hypothetical protein AAF348_19755 [Bacteroidota bacterium]